MYVPEEVQAFVSFSFVPANWDHGCGNLPYTAFGGQKIELRSSIASIRHLKPYAQVADLFPGLRRYGHNCRSGSQNEEI